MKRDYRRQVELLLEILPEVAKQSCFALHGGTAINFFVRDMPRLSIDVDLTYTLLEDRDSSLSNINQALDRIRSGIESTRKTMKVAHQQDVCKLFIRRGGAQIKIEVNTVNRGIIGATEQLNFAKARSRSSMRFV